jgi:hypothetical protein
MPAHQRLYVQDMRILVWRFPGRGQDRNSEGEEDKRRNDRSKRHLLRAAAAAKVASGLFIIQRLRLERCRLTETRRFVKSVDGRND